MAMQNEATLVSFASSADDDQQTIGQSLPSSFDLLTRNLRLLNLDLHRDWPGITKDTLIIKDGQKANSKARLRRVEWLLYHLFELWNPGVTEECLGMYFPALEPLQSIKLRSNAFLILDALKRDGLLPRGCSVRKTLLDECAGSKFEDLLLAFSTIILQKKQNGKPHLGCIVQLSTQRELAESATDSFLPLTTALHKKVNASMRHRQEYAKRYSNLQSELQVRSEYFRLLKDCNHSSLSSYDASIEQNGSNREALKRLARSTCNAENAWLEVAVSGDMSADRDALAETDNFDDLWSCFRVGFAPELEKRDGVSLQDSLGDLEATQSQRLSRWRRFQSQVSRRNGELVVSRSPVTSPRKTPRRPPYSSPSKKTKRNLFDSPFAPSVVRPFVRPTRFTPKTTNLDGTSKDTLEIDGGPRDSLTNDRDTLREVQSASKKLEQALSIPHTEVDSVTPSEQSTSHWASGKNGEDDYYSPSQKQQQNTAETPRLTLAQRTRKSMAFSAQRPPTQRMNDSVHGDKISPARPANEFGPLASLTEDMGNVSLAERAQQSMARLERSNTARQPTKHANHRKSRSHQLTRKPAFPVNPFDNQSSNDNMTQEDVPLQTSYDLSPTTATQRSRASTLVPDQTASVDGDSVFKPRSMLRRSPPRESTSDR